MFMSYAMGGHVRQRPGESFTVTVEKPCGIGVCTSYPSCPGYLSLGSFRNFVLSAEPEAGYGVAPVKPYWTALYDPLRMSKNSAGARDGRPPTV